MGFLSWLKPSQKPTSETKKSDSQTDSPPEIPGMNDVVEVKRQQTTLDVTIFEFGSVAASFDKVTLVGYCPVSDDLESCKWKILPASGSDAPQFRNIYLTTNDDCERRIANDDCERRRRQLRLAFLLISSLRIVSSVKLLYGNRIRFFAIY